MANVAEVLRHAVDMLKGYVDRRVDHIADRFHALSDRVSELAARPTPKDGAPGEPGKAGEPGRPGKDIDRAEIEAIVRELVPALVRGVDDQIRGAVAEAIKAHDEERRRDPAGSDTQEIRAIIAEEVKAAVAALPPPKDGAAGADGAPGEPGRDADMAEVGQLVDAAVKAALAALPPAKDGAAGADGAPGEPGKDGRGLAGATINRDGNLVITMSDGTPVDLGLVVGRDGTPGRDGFGLDDLVMDQIDERTLVVAFRRGDVAKEARIAIPGVVYRGIWKAGAFVKGDAVTFGGSLFIAERDTDEKPETGVDWRLAVKRGRDGKDGERGERGLPGPKGEDGKPWPTR